MTSIRRSLFAVVFAVLGACTQIEAPAPSGDDATTSSQSDLDLQSPGLLPSSLQTCLSHCQTGDLDCVDCCRCLAHGGSAPACCE
jgi:hypothetical protein